MVDINQLVEYIYSLVVQSGIDTYKYRMPNNLKGTYIVVKPLALVGRKDQTAVVNVNVYTDNLKLNIGGQNDQSQPNNAEMQRVLDLVLPLIEDNQWEQNVLVNIERSSPIYEETQTILNLRINYRKLNY